MRFFGGLGGGNFGISRRGRPWAGTRVSAGPLYGGLLVSPRGGGGGQVKLPADGSKTGKIARMRRYGDLLELEMENGDALGLELSAEGRETLRALLRD